jgi:S-adenosylmethionine hydrolase
MGIITLTSDFGLKDFYAAALKGRIYDIDEALKVVDISHQVTVANHIEAAFIMRYAYTAFPKGTVHLIAVQEVINEARMVAIEMDGHYFLCADNGILSLINPELKINKMVSVDFREDLSSVLFPSRDILCKAAVHLAKGGAIGLLGPALQEIKQSQPFRPRLLDDKSKILGRVVYVDNFGNLITNITRTFFEECRRDRTFEIVLPRRNKLYKLVNGYDEVDEGVVLALFNAQDLLEIAINGTGSAEFNGANTLLGVEVMNDITISFT